MNFLSFLAVDIQYFLPQLKTQGLNDSSHKQYDPQARMII